MYSNGGREGKREGKRGKDKNGDTGIEKTKKRKGEKRE